MSYENRLGLTQKKARFAQFETFLFLNKPVASRKDASRVKQKFPGPDELLPRAMR